MIWRRNAPRHQQRWYWMSYSSGIFHVSTRRVSSLIYSLTPGLWLACYKQHFNNSNNNKRYLAKASFRLTRLDTLNMGFDPRINGYTVTYDDVIFRWCNFLMFTKCIRRGAVVGNDTKLVLDIVANIFPFETILVLADNNFYINERMNENNRLKS